MSRSAHLADCGRCCSVSASSAESTPADEVTRVQIRLADGRKVTRAFRKTDKVETLYAYVEQQVRPTLHTPALPAPQPPHCSPWLSHVHCTGPRRPADGGSRRAGQRDAQRARLPAALGLPPQVARGGHGEDPGRGAARQRCHHHEVHELASQPASGRASAAQRTCVSSRREGQLRCAGSVSGRSDAHRSNSHQLRQRQETHACGYDEPNTISTPKREKLSQQHRSSGLSLCLSGCWFSVVATLLLSLLRLDISFLQDQLDPCHRLPHLCSIERRCPSAKASRRVDLNNSTQ